MRFELTLEFFRNLDPRVKILSWKGTVSKPALEP